MTKTIENTTPEATDIEVKNPVALLAKNKDLLGKLAEANATIQTTQAALKTEQEKHAMTTAQLRTARIEDPLQVIVNKLSPHPNLMTKTLKDIFDIALDSDGKPVLLKKDGSPLVWERKGKHGTKEDVPVTLEHESMVKWLLNGFEGHSDSPEVLMFKPQGSGAMGSNGSSFSASKAQAPTPAVTHVQPMPLGLR